MITGNNNESMVLNPPTYKHEHTLQLVRYIVYNYRYQTYMSRIYMYNGLFHNEFVTMLTSIPSMANVHNIKTLLKV